MKKIAVIMSVYMNDKLSLVQLAVNSILKQTYTLFDFYIQADGVLDFEVDEYLSSLEDPRIILRKRLVNIGLAKSLNELLEVVLKKDYDYIARMDADDISLSERLRTQFDFLENHSEVSCAGTWAIEIDSFGNEYFKKKMPITNRECYFFFQKRDCLIHPTVMFRKDYFFKAGLYPEDTYFGEDTMMWAKGFANNCVFANIPEYLFMFRLDANFFKRRRGLKHAKAILSLRFKVNNMLHYPLKAYMYACMYGLAKIMPTFLLNLIYKTLR